MAPHLSPADVTPRGAEALGERSHHDVDVCGVEVEVVDHAPTARTQSTDAVGLVQVQVGFIFLLQGNDFRQAHNGALHAKEKGWSQQLYNSAKFYLAFGSNFAFK